MHIAQDANFRLSNRARKGKTNNPLLQPGLAYMVDPRLVNNYVKDFVDKKEVCTHAFCPAIDPLADTNLS
jgi:hypothetical protein